MDNSSGDKEAFDKEWTEFKDIQKQIVSDFNQVKKGAKELYGKEKSLKGKLKEQMKQESRLVKLSGNDPQVVGELKEHITELKGINSQILNSGGQFLNMFLGTSINIVMEGDEKRKQQFKQEYEDFKYKWTLINIPLSLLFLFVFQNRALDTLYQLFLTYFYLSLAFRENVLRVNGSNIQRWWILHHYFSLLLTTTLLTWPETTGYRAFRYHFYLYAVYAGIVQLMQYRYQMQRLYVLKTLGRANVMDTVNSDSSQIILGREFLFLIPFIFIGHAMQVWNAYYLINFYLNHTGAEWQVLCVGIEFLILALGNIQTTIVVVLRKLKSKKKKQ